MCPQQKPGPDSALAEQPGGGPSWVRDEATDETARPLGRCLPLVRKWLVIRTWLLLLA